MRLFFHNILLHIITYVMEDYTLLNNNIINAITNHHNDELINFLQCSTPYNDIANVIHWFGASVDANNVFAYSMIIDIIALHKRKQNINTSILKRKHSNTK
jgi:hypothetical protein